MKNPREIIQGRFITPFADKNVGNIGVELEFPLINTNGGDIDIEFVASIMDFIGEKGFSCVLYGTGGEKLFMENEAGDCLSFDNSYNNFEFSMMYGDNLLDIKKRFDTYYTMVQDYLKKGGHTLVGRGTNPNYHNIKVNHTPFSTYNMVQEYLHNYPHKHEYTDFPAFMSSVQTHLDIPEKLIPRAYTLFSRLDFVRGLIFGNSPDFEGRGWRIFRDYLWEKSAFGTSPNITGSIDKSFETIDDVVDFYLEKGLFNRIRDGKYQVFTPTPIKDYFEKPDAKEEDIECYLSFCNVELTRRGTLEVRSDCTQKDGRFFMPPAFNLGILGNMEKAKETLDAFIKNCGIKKSNSELRKLVAENREEEIAPKYILDELCVNMLDIARDGLIKRNKGEETLLP
ncbi:MAG: hypothetical protein IJD91_06995 [Clostridia bacterium]|nr:hypothetical protein [Clostridia bacterium]